jgi:hypothetical protein
MPKDFQLRCSPSAQCCMMGRRGHVLQAEAVPDARYWDARMVKGALMKAFGGFFLFAVKACSAVSFSLARASI